MNRLFVCLLLVFTVGCSVNPVTGKRELSLVSEGQEIAIGSQQYSPSQQMQGGPYVVDPDLQAYVSEVGQKLAASSDRELPYEFVVLNNSVPNAWALPGGKIAVNRGLLLEMNSEAELAAVLGHEVVHAAARHGARSVTRGMLAQGAMVATSIAAQDSEYANVLLGGAQLAAGLIHQKYGRDAERESDYYGMQYMSRAGYDPQGAVALQETFVRLSEGRQSNWLDGLFASHPPSLERLEANRETAAALPEGGVLGVDSYKAATRSLRARAPAYEAYDNGQKALREKNFDEALRLAEQAISKVPKEGHFYALKADALSGKNRNRQAINSYSQAITRNDEFFYYPLMRGLLRKELGNAQGARQDLEASVALLPTATAQEALGAIAEGTGNFALAKQHYSEAAASRSPVGEKAGRSLLRLDLPDNPGKYVQTAIALDEQGRAWALLRNRTGVDMTGIALEVLMQDETGKVTRSRRALRGTLTSGKDERVSLGISNVPAERIRVNVTSARVAG